MKERKIDEVKRWLLDNRSRLSFRAIEQELEMPETTLYKVCVGRMRLPDKWADPLIDLKNRMCSFDDSCNDCA